MKYLILTLIIFVAGCFTQESDATFLQYSLMNKNSSGVIVDTDGNYHTKWERTVTSSNSSIINWGDNEEFFHWDDNWIYLDKYRNLTTKEEYEQYVTHQEFCQHNVCTIISTEGKQKYAPMIVNSNYTLDTIGYILTPQKNKIQFRHLQSVTVNVNCSTQYYSNQKCLIQNEKWWDDNQSVFSLKLYKNTWYAMNLGIGFMIQNKIPVVMTAYLK